MAVRSAGSDPGIGFQSARRAAAAPRMGERERERQEHQFRPGKFSANGGVAAGSVTVTISGSYSMPRRPRASLAAFACPDKGRCTALL